MTTARPEQDEHGHYPAPPRAIGNSTGLVYCMACGSLLTSDRRGRTARADKTCAPVRVEPRRGSDRCPGDAS